MGIGLGIGLELGVEWQEDLSDLTFSYFYPARYIFTLLSL